ncbi:hypothetical protein [uncultured phage cr106_1]|uniref:Uncharacterized protein n=1 Tax=uncultured phage cr106_1 TaxID=2772062 RepID=A0A7M1RXE4_9CAUD|nr:hypothetical protein KNV29_gp068 [uncultured phage cr106_1]QOR58319.1 hypothetical protein [uncultured phage cr106_1]
MRAERIGSIIRCNFSDLHYIVPFQGRSLSNYSENNIFERFIEVDLSGNSIECPVMCRVPIEQYLRNYTRETVEKVTVPLYTNNVPVPKRTASSIFKFFDTQAIDRLSKVTTNKGEIYYGGKGIILNSEFKVLVLCVCEYEQGENSGMTIPYICGYRAYIHPSVFLSSGLVEKGIIKTYIPSIVDGRIYCYDTSNALALSNSLEVEVIISDVTDKFIKTPVKPKIESFTVENVNKFLLDNLDEICNITKL